MTLKVLANIPKMDDQALSRLFINAQKMHNINNDQNAGLVLDAIKKEWAKRLELFEQNKYKASSPEQGVLHMVGYRVGNDGEKTAFRRHILNFIISDILPPVGSPAHMAEWGKPLSYDRYRKLHRVIRVLASRGKTMGNMDKAVSEWEDDLLYLEEFWRPKVK